MEETVYQCPECNFNADNLTELDLHLTENHSGEANHHHSARKITVNHSHLKEDASKTSRFIPIVNHGHHIEAESCHDENNLLDDDEEDFFNEKSNKIVHEDEDFDYANPNDENDEEETIGRDHIEENRYHESPMQNNSKNNLVTHHQHHHYQTGKLTENYAKALISPATLSTSIKPLNVNARHKKQSHENSFASPHSHTNGGATIATNTGPVLNSDNHYERQYACKRCDFFTNNPRAVLYHRKEFHMEKINVHECTFCQYASQYSGKVERHTMLRHKIDVTSSSSRSLIKKTNENSLKKVTDNESRASQDEASLLEKSSNSLSLNESFVHNSRVNLLMKQAENNSDSSFLRNSQYQTYQTRNLNSGFSGAKFQCNKCPCKYKRSSDLSKHLKQKHSIYPTNLKDYLTNDVSPVVNQTAIKSLHNNTNTNNIHDEENELGEEEIHSNGTYDDQDIDNMELHDSSSNDLKRHASQSMINRNFNQVQRRNINQVNRHSNGGGSSDVFLHRLPVVEIPSKIENVTKAKVNYECPYCTYFSNGNDADYLFHVKDHLCGKTFRCVLCNSVYKYRGDCVVHLKRKHQKADTIAHSYVDKFNLDNLDISQISALLKPKQNEDFENEEKLFGCAYCDYKANYKGDVFKHQTRRHPGTVKSVNSLGPSNHNGSDAHSSENNSGNSSFIGNSNRNPNRVNNNNEANGSSVNNEDYDELIINPEIYKTHQNGNGFFMDDDDDELNYDQENIDEMNEVDQDNDIIKCDDDLTLENEEDGDDEDFFNERSNRQNQLMEDEFVTNEDDDEENNLEIIEDDLGVSDAENEHQDPLKGNFDIAQKSRSQCKFCSFVAKSPAKLQLHLATHYNLKPFMCPVCKRRANFKWDIQKHLRKIHNDHHSEVICLSESEARKSINSYIEHKQFVHNNNANSIIYENSFEKILKTSEESDNMNGVEENGKGKDENDQKSSNTDSQNRSNNNYLSSLISQPNFRFITGRHNPHAIRERKFKCPMCIRTSKWQWDIKKHMRTVHKGRDGDVIVLKERNYQASLNNIINNNSNKTNVETDAKFNVSKVSPTLNSSLRSIGTTVNPISNSLFKNSILQTKLTSNLNSVASSPDSQNSIGSDATGNKKFKCSSCPYRSNWKADLFRHIKKRHNIVFPTLNNIIILRPEVAAQTLSEYESLHGINIRKRIRLELDGNVSESSDHSQEFQKHYHQPMNSDFLQNPANTQLMDDKGVERLPVSIAELNIKPYKCLKCGFRSDRKSDTLRHIKVKHNFQQPFSLLKILSIKEASTTIEMYERTKASTRMIRNTQFSNTIVNQNLTTTNTNTNSSSSSSSITTNNTTASINSSFNGVQFRKILPNSLLSVNNDSQQISINTAKAGNNESLESSKLTSNNNKKENFEVATLTSKKCDLVDYYKCPFCPFKNVNNLAMRRHLFIHYRGETIKINPIYRCNTCSFKSEWQYTVKKHIIACHLSKPNVTVLKLYNKNLGIIKVNSKPSSKMLRTRVKSEKMSINNNDLDDGKIDGKDSGLDEQDTKSVTSPPKSNNINEVQQHPLKILNELKREKPVTVNESSTWETKLCDEDNDDEECDENDDYSNYTDQIEENNENNLNGISMANMEDCDDAKVESISLTGYDGEKFIASYIVVMSTINNIKKKMYNCQSCPYKTNNFCNLKQHLVQHKFQNGYYKCRYCPYYVVKIRLLKQHETLHNDYEPRENSKRRSASNTGISFSAFPLHQNKLETSWLQ